MRGCSAVIRGRWVPVRPRLQELSPASLGGQRSGDVWRGVRVAREFEPLLRRLRQAFCDADAMSQHACRCGGVDHHCHTTLRTEVAVAGGEWSRSAASRADSAGQARTSLRRQTARGVRTAAREVITRQGVEALTLAEFGRRVGVTPAAPYRHFDDPSRAVGAGEARPAPGAARTWCWPTAATTTTSTVAWSGISA
ncbi:helix-turn-helix domain-containing protein [Streptomyces sp. NPDC056468]|uniref:helix-turn-helix domain-containing protein n=1 Tax=Streptomyces sp. NPDC056468 TaxID=3345830 RepID=UPI0036B2AAA3